MSKLMENAQSVLQLVEEYGRNCAEFGCYGPALENIRAAVQELERDAARYRWLRDGNSIQIFGVHECWTTSHRLDIVVDTLMTKTNEGDVK